MSYKPWMNEAKLPQTPVYAWYDEFSKDFKYDEVFIKEKTNKLNIKSKIMNVIKFAKNLTLSADEKLLRKYNLKDSNGEYTDEAEEIVMQKLIAENESHLVEIAKAMEAEEIKK